MYASYGGGVDLLLRAGRALPPRGGVGSIYGHRRMVRYLQHL
jgi:hypothetical protein